MLTFDIEYMQTGEGEEDTSDLLPTHFAVHKRPIYKLQIWCFFLWLALLKRVSVVGIVATLQAGRSGIRTLIGQEFFGFAKTSTPTLVPHSLGFNGIRE